MRMTRWLLSLLMCGGCAGGTGDKDSAADSGRPVAGTAACLEDWSDGVQPIDPDGPDTQIHSAVAFDGDRLWFTWNRPNAAAGFDVWRSITDCAGATVASPFALSDADDVEIDPTLAFSDAGVLVVWTGSTDAGLDIRSRVLDTDGSPVTEVSPFSATRAGEPVSGNATLPAAVGDGDGFVLAGSWGHPGAPAFQAFVVRLGPDGEPVADAEDVELDPVRGQTYVDVALEGGAPRVVWQEDGTDTVDPVAWSGAPGATATLLAEPGARPAVVVAEAGRWEAWDDNAGQVWLRGPDGASAALDLGDGFHHTPQLAAVGDTIAVLTMEVDSGIYNRLRLSVVSASGAIEDVPLSAAAAPSVYEASLALVDETHAVVAWQEGENPAFRAYAEWVSW